MKQGHAPRHAPAIAWFIPVFILTVLVVALKQVLPDGDVLQYVVGDDPIGFVVGFVCLYLVVAAILDVMVRMWEQSRRVAPLSEDRLYDVLFWSIRGIRIGMDPRYIANRLVDRTNGRVDERARLCIDCAVKALWDAATRDQVLLWEERERDLKVAEGWLNTARL